MMNLFSAFDRLTIQQGIIIWNTIFAGLTIAVVDGGMLQGGFNPFLAALLGLCVAYTLFIQSRIRKFSAPIGQIAEVLNAATNGNFGKRIVQMKCKDDFQQISWALNEMLDQLEAYFREVQTSASHISEGHSFRKPMPVGLHGSIRTSLEDVSHYFDNVSENSRNVLKNELLSSLSQLNSSYLLKNLTLNKEDLRSMSNKMEDVTAISQETVHEAEDSKHAIQ